MSPSVPDHGSTLPHQSLCVKLAVTDMRIKDYTNLRNVRSTHCYRDDSVLRKLNIYIDDWYFVGVDVSGWKMRGKCGRRRDTLATRDGASTD